MACVIPFPTRRPASKRNDYSFLTEHIAAFSSEWLRKEQTKKTQEEEVLKLLRRIDRSLVKISTAQGENHG